MKVKVEHKKLWITLIAVIALVYAFVKGCRVYYNYLNIAEIGVGFVQAYIKNIKVEIAVKTMFFLLSFTVFYVTNTVLRRNLLKWEETAYFLNSKLSMFFACAFLAVLSMIAVPEEFSSNFLTASNHAWFVQSDPIFNKNIGYYVFQRPLFMNVTVLSASLLTMMLVYMLIIYAMYYVRNGCKSIKEVLAQSGIVTHFAVVILLIFGVLALSCTFFAEELLYHKNGELTGGGYTDINIWVQFYKILPLILCAIVIIAVTSIVRKKSYPLFASIASLPILFIVVFVISAAVENFVVQPNEESFERGYIKNNIDATNIAYNIDTVQEYEYSIKNTITEQDIKDSAAEIAAVPVADEDITLSSYNNMQGIRDYYGFDSINVISYLDGGQRKTAYAAVRNILPKTSNEKKSTEYINTKMKYTHGYGLVASATGSVTAEGRPDFILPAEEGKTAPLTINQPRVYFGNYPENEYVLAGTLQKEMDYFDSKNEQEYSYTGSAGVRLNWFNKMIYAANLADINLAISGYITDESKILTNRNVIDRVQLALPFLTFDETMNIAVTSDGRLVWVVDGYTTTDNYPYSQRMKIFDSDKTVNYIRNSVKVVVDAYNGTVDAYVIDWNDPMIRTYQALYPNSFAAGSLPFDIAYQSEYPEELFNIQTQLYQKYHQTNPSVFYSKSDEWKLTQEKYGENSELRNTEPYYYVTGRQGIDNELLMVSSFSVSGSKSNLAAWLCASSDMRNYGRLTSYVLPKDKFVGGSLNIENRIDIDSEIAKEISQLKGETNKVIKGHLYTVPLMDTVIYVKPLYVKSSALNSLPELKRIIVACGDTVVSDLTLVSALEKLAAAKPEIQYGELIKTDELIDGDEEIDLTEKITQAIDKYNEANWFKTENDWVNYGKTMKEFEDILGEIEHNLTYPEDYVDLQEETENETGVETSDE